MRELHVNCEELCEEAVKYRHQFKTMVTGGKTAEELIAMAAMMRAMSTLLEEQMTLLYPRDANTIHGLIEGMGESYLEHSRVVSFVRETGDVPG